MDDPLLFYIWSDGSTKEAILFAHVNNVYRMGLDVFMGNDEVTRRVIGIKYDAVYDDQFTNGKFMGMRVRLAMSLDLLREIMP